MAGSIVSRHPHRRALLRWAAGTRDDLTRHVSSCERCLNELDTLTALDQETRDLLARVVTPQAGFADRISLAIEKRDKDAATWSVAADLFSLGWRVLDAMVEEDDD
jgi:hypothetical protein